MASDTTAEDDGVERFTGPDTLSVFVESDEKLTFKLLPRFDTGRILWAVQIIPPETEHAAYESVEGITDSAVEAFDLSIENVHPDLPFETSHSDLPITRGDPV